ncbi:MAG: MG2 domain-containing protein [Promethearchaeota archaeon]
MFKRIFGLFLVLVLFTNIYQTLGVTIEGYIENNNDFFNFDRNNSLFPVDRVVEPIDEEYQSQPRVFQPSPLTMEELKPSIIKRTSYSNRLVINIDLKDQITSPNEPLYFTIQANRGLNPAVGETLRLEIIEGEYWGWYYYYDYQPRSERVVHTDVITTNSNGEWSGSYTTGASGRYSIIVRSETESITRYRAFTVASIGLFWRVPYEFVPEVPHRSIAYVLNTTDFSPITSVDVELVVGSYSYDYNTSKYTYTSESPLNWQTDDQGIVEVEFTPSETLSASWSILANLSATFNDETVYVIRDLYRGGYSWDWNGNYEEFTPYEFIITTDKPIYLPTETINVRILVWKNDYYKAIKEPIETEVTLKFLSPSQHILFEKVMTTDEYGILSYSFTLDPDTELGDYYIHVEKGDSDDIVKIRVDKYEKPAFRVLLNLDQEYVAPGKVLSGSVTAEYYFGRPVSNSQIELLIGDFKVLSGMTDTNGYWEFSQRLPSEDEFEDKTSIPINVTVTDTVGLEVAVSDNLQITDYIYVWSYINPWFPKVDEPVTVYFGAYQVIGTRYWWWNWEPVTEANVEITLYGVSSTDKNITLAKFDSYIGDTGHGSYEFNLTHSMLSDFIHFRLLIGLVSKDGREGSDLIRFSVDRNSLKVSLDSTIYAPNEDVQLSVEIINRISNEQVEGTVLLRVYDPDFDLIVETEEEIAEEGESLVFKLSSKAPSGKYRLWIYLETEVSFEWGSYIMFRSPTTLEFSVGTPQEISLSSDKEKYSIDERIKLQCNLDGNTNAPVMVQFIKRGIVATELVDLPPIDSFTLNIDEIGFLAPYFYIYVFAILNDGTILDTYLKIEVDSTIEVEITSDRPIYEPGETANVAIRVTDAKDNPISAVLAVSFVDSSVYGVEPDPELESEHFDDSSYWPSVLTVASWKSRQELWWFWWYEEYTILRGGMYWGYENVDYFAVPAAMGPERGQEVGDEEKSTSQEPEEKGENIRDNLPENAFWNPCVIIESGFWEMEITLPDTIGEWTVRVVATTEAGAGVLEKNTFKTFLPFFVEINKDPYVLQDDVFVIRGIVYNYLEEQVNITLRLDTEQGVLLLGFEEQHVYLPSGFLGSIGWACLAEGSGYFNITLYGSTTVSNGSEFKDAIRKPLNVLPNGVSFNAKESGFVTSTPSFSYEKYIEAVQATEFLQLTLGFGTAAISSWERLIGYPYGCVEQTTSRLIPNALVLQYLADSGQLDNETKEVLENMIVTGLSRLYSFQHNDGGWGWWYDDESKVFMTSIALYCLGLINDIGITVDSGVVEKGLKYLTTYQQGDGYWEPDSWRNIDRGAFTAVVLRSILAFKGLTDIYVINDAIDYIESAWIDSNNTYIAGLYLTSVPGSGFERSSFTADLVDYLVKGAKYSTKGSYWTYATEDNYWWRALGGDVEVTALAIQALVVNDAEPNMHIIQRALEWLLDRQSYYGWGNTADTAAAITSLITVNRELSSSNNDTTIAVYVNDQLQGNYSLSLSSQASVYIKLSDILSMGTNQFEFVKYGSGNVSFYFQGFQVLRSTPLIELPEKIEANSGSEVAVEISLSPQSSRKVFASDLTLVPIQGDITPLMNKSQSISLLTQNVSVFYEYKAPVETGSYLIPGFEITYQLADENKDEKSPGIISRRYGPIELEVTDQSSNLFLPIPTPESGSQVSSEIIKQKESQEALSLEREYSKSTSYQRGDLVTVTLSITNTKQAENFIMLEDTIPSGFDLDPTTIIHPEATYEVTSSGIAFFFPELEIGTTEVSYGIIAMDVRQSLVPPAQLSSMYHDWIIHSESKVLGATRIPIDPLTGNVITDMEFPEIKNLKLEEGVHGGKAVLNVAVETEDNWGIASVRVFIEQEAWGIYECIEEYDTWTVQIFKLHDGHTQVYLEVIDLAGNTIVSGTTEKYLELDSLVIPVLPILVLLIVAAVFASVASVTLRKKWR